MKRAVLWALPAVFLLACGLLQGLSQVQEGVEFYATQLPQTLESQRPTLEAVMTQAAQQAPSSPGTVPAPAASPTPGQPQGQAQGLQVRGALVELEDVRTGRERFVHTVTVGDRTFTVMEWVHEFDREAQAESWVIRQAGAEEQSIVLIGDTQWYKQGDLWVQVTIAPQDIRPALLGMITRVPEDVVWQRVGEETINGMNTVRYRSEGLALPPMALAPGDIPDMPPIMGAPRVEQVVAEIWVTPEGYLVRGQIRWDMTFTLMDGNPTPGNETVYWEITDINQPITIELPEGVGQTPEPPFPMPPEATLANYVSQPSIWQYNVANWDLNQAVDYLDALSAQGFQVLERFVGEGTARFVLQGPDGRTWEVVVSANLAGPGISFIIRALP